MSGASLHEEIRGLVARVAPVDAVEDGHRRQALAWPDSTSDVFRRVKPGTTGRTGQPLAPDPGEFRAARW